MIYPGLKDDKRIDDLIAYLKQFDASGKKSPKGSNRLDARGGNDAQPAGG
jgi:hypothetical protein